MAQKTSEKGLAGDTAPAVTEPGRVRNVVLVGHSGSGKTTLVEALLAATGDDQPGRHRSPTAPRSPITIRRPYASSGRSRCPAPRVMHDGRQDQPAGHPGLCRLRRGAARRPAGRGRRALRRLRGRRCGRRATTALWDECAAVGMPRAVAITRLDHPRADFEGTLEDCQEAFGENVMPIYQPMLGDDGQSIVGLLGLVTLRVLDYSAGYPPRAGEAERRAPDADRGGPQHAHRGDHRRERGRDPDGPLPRRRD